MLLCRVLLALVIAVPSVAAARPDPAQKAYESARRSYYALKDDAARRKLRHHWLSAADRFEDVAKRYPKSARAPDALFTAAELLNELSRISRLDEDLKRAMDNYEEVSTTYAASSLQDDAALALARIYGDRLGQPEQARKVLERGAARGKGDRARELSAYAASLEPSAPRLSFEAPPKPKKNTALAQRPEAARPAQPERSDKAALAQRPEAAPPAPPERAVTPVAVAEPRPHLEVSEATPTPESSRSKALADAFARVSSAAARVPAPGARDDEPVAGVRADPPKPPTAEELKARLPGAEDGGITLAEQLGLKVRRVIIDPGHGGHDSGALGKDKLMEKDVTLEVSKLVADQLRAEGLEVILTRDDDRFVRLEDRARIANEQHGDLFISIHCNSAPTRKLRGIETYTLNTSADRYSIRLAARENASSEKGISDLQFILADLATKANTEESTRLATKVQQSLVQGLSAKHKGIKDLGTKEALFYVLLGVRMPAILVETSFLSHPEEGALLGTKAYQADLARSISSGVVDFLEQRGQLARMD